MSSGVANDLDNDGLDDAQELAWAQQYLPYLSLSPNDECPTGGLAVRVSPHPTAPGFIQIRYDYLYNDDCGIGGHVGDDENFAITINPSVPPPDGIIAMIGIPHKGSECQKTTTCGQCAGLTACETLVKDGVPFPTIWPAKDKHGNYVNRMTECELLNTCLDECQDDAAPAMPPIVNVGEPCFPLVSNLTTQGFITTANGWTHQELFNYDPWGGQNFGGASVIAADLTDPMLDTPACP
jgi:hypothetical protein